MKKESRQEKGPNAHFTAANQNSICGRRGSRGGAGLCRNLPRFKEGGSDIGKIGGKEELTPSYEANSQDRRDRRGRETNLEKKSCDAKQSSDKEERHLRPGVRNS